MQPSIARAIGLLWEDVSRNPHRWKSGEVGFIWNMNFGQQPVEMSPAQRNWFNDLWHRYWFNDYQGCEREESRSSKTEELHDQISTLRSAITIQGERISNLEAQYSRLRSFIFGE